MTLLKLSILAN